VGGEIANYYQTTAIPSIDFLKLQIDFG